MSGVFDARSLLFVPGDRPERYAKALAAGADAVIVDLEDAVSPDAKGRAAEALRGAWGGIDATRVLIRINAVGTPWHDDDVMLCAALRPAAVVVPKAEAPDALLHIGVATAAGERGLYALIESAVGVANVRAIAACPAVGRLVLGHLDLQADLGMQCDVDERELDGVRFELVLASRLAGIAAPVDGVTVATDDDARLTDDAKRAVRYGFGGKLCIHPRQVVPLHTSFAPSREQLAWAERVVQAAAASGGGAVRVDGRMVDRPVLLLAERMLHRGGALTRP